MEFGETRERMLDRDNLLQALQSKIKVLKAAGALRRLDNKNKSK